jgi:proteasome lid subunit RPN8/RPN11
MSTDEPIFLEDDAGAASVRFALPEFHRYVGTGEDGAAGGGFPCLYLDWAVALRLQAEGQRSIREEREVAGILLGTCSADAEVIKVSHIAVARDEDSSPVHFKFTYSVWDDLIDQMEEMSRATGEKLLLLGWYHTHPNMAVFLSRYDLRTHRDFHRPYQFALVLAPKAGTADTSVGFFVNRGEGLPLLPGVRCFGMDSRTDVGRALPWRFQLLEAEGVEEGEGDRGSSGDARAVAEPPRVFQLGVVKEGRGDWLQLQADPSEGPVLPILEGMAAAVVEDGADRLGVLLGMRTEEGNTVISRVRFLGKLNPDPEEERRDLLTALGFIAEQFPSSGLQKILGVVRIVSPRRFSAGDRYDPSEHNIAIARFLREIGYEFEEYVAQVALVLYPGVEDDVLYFQVFAQLGDSLLVRTGFQALAPVAQRANERYEPVAQKVFVLEDTPCLTPPRSGVPSKPKNSRLLPEVSAPPTQDLSAIRETETGSIAAVDPLLSTGTHPPAVAERSRGRIVVLSILLLLAAILSWALARKDGGNQVPGGPGVTVSGDELGLQPPYEPAVPLPRCGGPWNPEATCRPFADVEDGDTAVEFVRVTPTGSYTNLSAAPPEAWLVPTDGSERKKIQLERKKEGEASAFLLRRKGPSWEGFWGQGDEFRARLVILPRGATVDGGDEYESLRLVLDLALQGPPPSEEATAATGGGTDPGTSGGWAPSVVKLGSGAQAAWENSGGPREGRAIYDLGRESFEKLPVISAVGQPRGDWSFEVRRQRGGSRVEQRILGNQDPGAGSGEVNPRITLVDLFRDPDVSTMLSQVGTKEGAHVWVFVRPPEGAELVLDGTLSGEAKAPRVRHKICVTLVADAPGGGLRSVDGEVDVGTGDWRPTAALQENGGSPCVDKSRSTLWHPVELSEDAAVLRFNSSLVKSADREMLAAGLRINLRAWASKDRGSQCLSVQLRLNQLGLPADAPDIRAIGRLDGDRCR